MIKLFSSQHPTTTLNNCLNLLTFCSRFNYFKVINQKIIFRHHVKCLVRVEYTSDIIHQIILFNQLPLSLLPFITFLTLSVIVIKNTKKHFRECRNKVHNSIFYHKGEGKLFVKQIFFQVALSCDIVPLQRDAMIKSLLPAGSIETGLVIVS